MVNDWRTAVVGRYRLTARVRNEKVRQNTASKVWKLIHEIIYTT
jgi:hypothetical protein